MNEALNRALSRTLAVAAALALVALPAVATKYVPGESPVGATAPEGGVVVDFSDNFDGYATGSQLHGQGGWKGWDNNPAAGAIATGAAAYSPPNSAEIFGPSDLVHEFSGYTSGVWTLAFRVYVPSDFSGQSYAILLNSYADGGPYNWSTQILFDSGLGTVYCDGCSFGGSLPLVTGGWVPVVVEIDFDSDLQTIYYDGQILGQGSWTNGVSGGGVLNLAAIDLYANSASRIFYDSLTISRLASTQEIPTLGGWGLALLFVVLAAAAMLFLARRRATA